MIIKQAAIYIDFTKSDIEHYDHTLILCDCNNLMEKGVGLCEKCIEYESKINEIILEKLNER